MIADLPDLIARRALLGPERIALEEHETGRTLTYAELDRRAAAAASALRSRGVGEGDRVAILCRNRIAFFELLFACAKLGAILVPLNWRMPPAELDQLIDDCAPTLLIHGAEDGEAAAALSQAPPALDLDADYETALAEAAVPAGLRSHWRADGIWYLLYTSGTTGRPKGVIYTYRMAVANFVNIGTAIDISSSDTTPNFLPLFHTAGINLHSLPTLFQGGKVLILDGFDAETLVSLFEARRLDTFFAVPTVYQALLDHPRFASAPLGHVRNWGCGGAPLPDVLAEKCRRLGIRICNGMGMTETGPTAFLASPCDPDAPIGSVGKPQILVSVRIVDEAGHDVPDGQVGDLLFSGPAVTPGYWNNEEATRAAFTQDGWLRSGDLARRGDDGFYYVVGRRKEMFISGGENVYPAEVENVLAAHPAIHEAAVLPRADDKWGEVGRALVQLADGEQPPEPAELETWCRARLAAYKVPKSFEFVEDFPRTAAGKVQKHLLAEPAGSSPCDCGPSRPRPPIIQGQSATAPAHPPSLDDALSWTYGFETSLQAMPGDALEILVLLNDLSFETRPEGEEQPSGAATEWRYTIFLPETDGASATGATADDRPPSSGLRVSRAIRDSTELPPWPDIQGYRTPADNSASAHYSGAWPDSGLLKFSLDRLFVVAVQSAAVKTRIVRKANPGPGEETGSFTASDWVTVPAPVRPLIEAEGEFLTVGEGAASLIDTLDALFRPIVDGPSTPGATQGPITLSLRADYLVGPGQGGDPRRPLISIPILLVQGQSVPANSGSGDSLEHFKADLAAALSSWWTAVRPAGAGAALGFAIDLHASDMDKPTLLARMPQARVPIPEGRPEWWPQ